MKLLVLDFSKSRWRHKLQGNFITWTRIGRTPFVWLYAEGEYPLFLAIINYMIVRFKMWRGMKL